MIYYCVKTSEYLADILDKVSRETQYYFQLDVPLDRAESIIEKFQKRYDLNQTARQRNYRLKQKPVVDLIEPYRVCRRVNILRDYPDDKIKIYP